MVGNGYKENQRVYKRRSYVLKCNWKILSEGGIEAYHYNVAHRNTLAPFFLGNLSTWESWGGRDMRMILPKQTMLEAKNMPEEQWDMRQFANVFYTMAPTMAILAQPDNVSLIKMVPLGPGETEVEEVLLEAAYADPRNANVNNHSGGGASPSFTQYVYIAIWFR